MGEREGRTCHTSIQLAPYDSFSILRPIRQIWADGAYAGPLVDWVWALRPQRPIRLEITKRSDRLKGFVVIPKR